VEGTASKTSIRKQSRRNSKRTSLKQLKAAEELSASGKDVILILLLDTEVIMAGRFGMLFIASSKPPMFNVLSCAG
jgi:hypothetical protein